jgi:hypothetical protein
MIFDIQNWLWKLNFGTLWHLPITSKKSTISFGYVDFFAKNLSNSVSPAWKLDNLYYHNWHSGRLSYEIMIMQSKMFSTLDWNLP